jgi:hypothetical protein
MAQLLSNTRIYGFASIDSQTIVGNVTPIASTSNVSGSLVVTGGAGISGNLYATAVYSNGSLVLTSSGYLANSIIFANTTGYLSNVSGLQYFTSNNTLYTTSLYSGNVILSDASVLRSANTTATMQIVGGANGTYYFTAYSPKALTVRYLSTTAIGTGNATVTVYVANSTQNVGGLTNVVANSATPALFSATNNNAVSFGQSVTAIVTNSTIASSNSIVLTLGMS